jgi:C_GCAxxG_C_C family probable redox protein
MGKLIRHLEDCFESEEDKKYWHDMRGESEEEKLIRRIKTEAAENQIKYRCCSQNTLFALQRHLDIGNKEVFKAASAVSGGILGKGVHICGALVGGLLAIGLEFGRADFLEPGTPREPGPSNFLRMRELGTELYEQFKEEFGAHICIDIQRRHFGWQLYPINHDDPYHEELHQSGEMYDMLSTYAYKVVARVAEMTTRIILRERNRRA